MAARIRSNKNRDLEPNLYESGGYYKYRHPQTGKYHGMGSDRKKANVAARKLNAMLIPTNDLVSRVITEQSVLFGEIITRYRKEYLPTKKLKPRTLEEVTYRLNRLERDLKDKRVDSMSIKVIADYLDENFQNNAYIKFRGLLSELFRFGATKGLCDTNPAENTLAKVADDKKRRPLTREWYNAIYAHADDWLKVAMDFALITLQRRSDLCAAKFDDIRDGHLHLIQQKTEKHGLRAHLRIRVVSSLDNVIKRSRQSGIASPYIIHRRPVRIRRSKSLVHWSQIRPETLSKEFAKARDKVPEIAQLPISQRPTIHEVRALGGHLYFEAGFPDEYVQTLMGHSTLKMTHHYTDRHIKWTVCEAALPI
ncbi:tyrosine-type recombinase/integrase [Nitrincola iocasae]|uniref:Tyrosine-type recombinase/integrase n=2 Tax=Nitrincola iocasae TaxID=2614693 RepID=A0A5J6LDK5_9GAMM|nr:tyrosine-type recombinase/integrase [Nitrincola iocasae]